MNLWRNLRISSNPGEKQRNNGSHQFHGISYYISIIYQVTISVEKDKIFMKEAIKAGKKGLGKTSPNPAVGAVIVRNGQIISTGYHKKAGCNHAEVEALLNMKEKIRAGDTMYVTLEPCNHKCKTPPCTEAILKSGLKRVVIGMLDPNPSVKGGGLKYLREKGIEVKSGVLESECRLLIEDYIKFVKTGRPFVIGKSALTIDGWTATSTGNSKWVTCEKSREFVHRLRARVDAILVGIGTVMADDPLLTVRTREKVKKDLHRIIVDTNLRIPHNAKLLNSDSTSKILIAVGKDVNERMVKEIEDNNISVIRCPLKNRGLDLNALMDILGQREISSLLVEGGAGIMGSMIRDRLIDKFYIFQAPKILGGDDGIPMARGMGPLKMDESLILKDIKIRRFNDDIMIRGYPEYKCLQD